MAKAKPAQASAPASVWVEPVEGYFINGVPHVAQAVTADTAAYLLATGAFTEGTAPDDAEPNAEVAAATHAAVAIATASPEPEPAEAPAEEPSTEPTDAGEPQE